MTQREQYRTVRHLSNFIYTPGAPGLSGMIHRLAVKAQILAAEEGEELTYEEARSRAKENLGWVYKQAGGES